MNSATTQTPTPTGRSAAARTPASLREVMSRFATGVTVLSVGGESIHGMTANAFTSVSLTPPTVLVSIAHSAVMYRAITSAGHFGVSIMGAGQEGLARFFADKKRPLGPAQFTGIDWERGERTGAPLLAGALAWLECEVTEAHDSGDHTLFIGTVADAGLGDQDSGGLLFYDGGFQRLAPHGR
ncbi:flavin reductase family protein [Streptomyces sp. NPDC087917]|uniref:flavin reductase family protein n=1 Tax=unclassified Streptomyces TaxID=2593676 RepID=UPI003431000F